MSRLSVFLPFTKVDAVNRTVTGIFTQEQPDRVREVMDYESSKPYFEKWSGELAQISGGKNYGNVREMHQPNAVGCFNAPIEFDDVAKTMSATAYIDDDNTWRKIEKGILTGFSIGGSYAKRWTDPQNPQLKRFTAEPVETSVVDLPCLKTATFTMVKAVGCETIEHFDPSVATLEEPPPLLKVEGVEGATVDKGSDGSTHITDVSPLVPSADGAGALAADIVERQRIASSNTVHKDASGNIVLPEGFDPNAVAQVWLAADGTPFSKKADSIKHNESLAAQAAVSQVTANVTAGMAKINELLGIGKSSNPTPGPGTAVGGGEGGTPTIPAPPVEGSNADGTNNHQDYQISAPSIPGWSMGMLSKLGMKLPWQKLTVEKGASEASMRKQRLQKGMYDISRVASLLVELKWLKDCMAAEKAQEGDKSTLPDQMQDLINQMCMFLVALTAEETSELMTGADDPGDMGGDTIIILAAAAGPKVADMSAMFKTWDPALLPKNWTAMLDKAAADISKDPARAFNKFAGAVGAGEDITEHPAFRKVLTENAAFRDEITTLGTQVNDMAKRFEEFLKAPQAPKGFQRETPLTVVTKEADGLLNKTIGQQIPTDPEGIVRAFSASLAGMSMDERAKVMMKMSLASPVLVQNG